MAGVGIGMCFIHGGSTGGTDIIAAMVSKHSNVSIGRMMIYVDMCIISSSFFIFHRIETVVYGLTVLFFSSYMADLIINTNRQAMQFTIFSTKWMQIADAINNEAHRGCTVFDGVGWYSKRPVKMLMVMCRKIESVGIFRIIKTIDPDAIVTQTNVNGVYGQGFDRIKVRIPKNNSELSEAIQADTTSDYGHGYGHSTEPGGPTRRPSQHGTLGGSPADEGCGGPVRI